MSLRRRYIVERGTYRSRVDPDDPLLKNAVDIVLSVHLKVGRRSFLLKVLRRPEWAR